MKFLKFKKKMSIYFLIIIKIKELIELPISQIFDMIQLLFAINLKAIKKSELEDDRMGKLL